MTQMTRRIAILLLILTATLQGVGAPLHSVAEETPNAVRAEATTLWSVRASSSRKATGAVDAVRRLHAAGMPDAGMLMLFDDAGTLWYVVEIAHTDNREDARRIADTFTAETGTRCLIRSMDAALHATRRVSGEGLRNSELIPPPVAPDTDPATPAATADAADIATASEPAPGTISSPASGSDAVTDITHPDTLVTNTDIAPAPERMVKSAMTLSPQMALPRPASNVGNGTPALAEVPLRRNPDERSPLGITEESTGKTPEAEAATPFTLDTKQAEIILARSLYRQGDLEGAREVYRQLLLRHGQDETILEGYTETLMDGRRWAEADAELVAWRAAMPHSISAIRQTARLHLTMAEETGNYEASFPWLEQLMEHAPEDTWAIMDYAYARRNAGDWEKALRLFSAVYDANPDDENAAENIQTILRERGPQLAADYRSEVQAGDVSINTFTVDYSQQLSSMWRAHVAHTRSRLDRRSDEDGTASIARELRLHEAGVTYEPSRRWLLGAGIQYYEGVGEGVAPSLSLEHRLNVSGLVRLNTQLEAPWYTTLDAASRDGTTDTFTLTLEKPLTDNWYLAASAGAQRYSLEGLSGYAWQEREELALTRRLHFMPDVTASYIFTRTRMNYRQNNPGERPVDLVDKEDIHTLRVEMLHWYNEYIALRTFGSAGYDVFRLSPLLGTGGGVRLRLGQRLDLDIGAEYNNDTGQPGGGESKAFTTSIIYHF